MRGPAWSLTLRDFDLDGRIDLAHTNGWDDPSFIADQTCVFRNTSAAGTLLFQQAAPACGMVNFRSGSFSEVM